MSLNTLARKAANAGADFAKVIFLGAVVPLTAVSLLSLFA